MKTKICSVCKIDKPHSEYFKDNNRAIGIRCKCKDCERDAIYKWREKNKGAYNNYAAMWRARNPTRQHANEIRRNYGLEIKEYEKMLVSQNYGCKICGKKHDITVRKGRLFVDHNHTTGAIRGLLCRGCNVGMGNLQDDISILEKAIAYLKEHA